MTTAKKTTKRTTKKKPAAVAVPTIKLPAVEGIEAGRLYWCCTVQWSLVERLFTWTNAQVHPSLRQQRKIQAGKVNKLTQYLNQDFFSLGAEIGEIEAPKGAWDSLKMEYIDEASQMGYLHIPIDSVIYIADGQHRLKSVVNYIKKNGELPKKEQRDLYGETVTLIFHRYQSLEISQQRFADHNGNLTKPSSSLNKYYDSRDRLNRIARAVYKDVFIFNRFTSLEATSLNNSEDYCFTFNALVSYCKILVEYRLKQTELGEPSEQDLIDMIAAYSKALLGIIPAWEYLGRGEMKPAAVRNETLTAHAITLEALAYLGESFLMGFDYDSPNFTKAFVDKLQDTYMVSVDWNIDNPHFDQLIRVEGQIQKNKTNAVKLAQYLKEGLSNS